MVDRMGRSNLYLIKVIGRQNKNQEKAIFKEVF
jgi:hypothetical protein